MRLWFWLGLRLWFWLGLWLRFRLGPRPRLITPLETTQLVGEPSGKRPTEALSNVGSATTGTRLGEFTRRQLP